jgi:hypothetical protein
MSQITGKSEDSPMVRVGGDTARMYMRVGDSDSSMSR